MKKLLLSPSIMCDDVFDLPRDFKVFERYGYDFLHVDVADGHFVPNLTFGYDFVNLLGKYSSIPKDIHLMVVHPLASVGKLELGPDDLVNFHIESKDDSGEVITAIRAKKAKVGLAVSPDTDLKTLIPYLDKVDNILVLTVYPGFAGKPFVEKSYDRVGELAGIIQRDFPHVIIGVDGAIGFEQIKKFRELGAGLFVLGTTALFGGDIEERAKELAAHVNTIE